MNWIPLALSGVLMTGNTASMPTDQAYLALGDSYTIGQSVSLDERWPQQLARTLRAHGMPIGDPVFIAKTGWRTDHLKSAIDSAHLKNEFALVSLSIGVNNQYQGQSAQQYAREFEELLLTAIELAKGVKEHVFVLSIPDYGYIPFGKTRQNDISQALEPFNAINESIAKRLGVKYFNITDISRQGLEQSDLIAYDGLHPSGKMYALWVARTLKGLLDTP